MTNVNAFNVQMKDLHAHLLYHGKMTLDVAKCITPDWIFFFFFEVI